MTVLKFDFQYFVITYRFTLRKCCIYQLFLNILFKRAIIFVNLSGNGHNNFAHEGLLYLKSLE